MNVTNVSQEVYCNTKELSNLRFFAKNNILTAFQGLLNYLFFCRCWGVKKEGGINKNGCTLFFRVKVFIQNSLYIIIYYLFCVCFIFVSIMHIVHLLELCVFTKSCCFLFVVIAN